MHNKPWEQIGVFLVGIGNVVLGTLTFLEGTIIPHFMIWGGAGLLLYNWRLAFKRKNDRDDP